MRWILMLGAVMLAALPSSAMAFADPDQQAAKAPAEEAMALARLMSPRDLLVAMELREYDKNFVPSLRSNPELKALDDEFPGLFVAMHKASRELVAESTGRSIDRIHASIAQLAETSFTPADIAELTAFYRSPVGRKAVEQMTASADTSQLYRQAVDDENFKLTEDQVATQVRSAAQKAVGNFTPDEQTQLILFMAKPSFLKLAKAQPAIKKILVDRYNEADPEFEARIDEAMAAAIEHHIAAAEKSGAKREAK